MLCVFAVVVFAEFRSGSPGALGLSTSPMPGHPACGGANAGRDSESFRPAQALAHAKTPNQVCPRLRWQR
jgi:hypothetical protein